jgi:hypothetical protein
MCALNFSWDGQWIVPWISVDFGEWYEAERCLISRIEYQMWSVWKKGAGWKSERFCWRGLESLVHTPIQIYCRYREMNEIRRVVVEKRCIPFSPGGWVAPFLARPYRWPILPLDLHLQFWPFSYQSYVQRAEQRRLSNGVILYILLLVSLDETRIYSIAYTLRLCFDLSLSPWS